MPEKPPLVITPEDSLLPALEAFKKGGVIAYPTETFYALGIDPSNEKAAKSLFALKGRPADRPVSLIIKDEAMLSLVVCDVPEIARRLMKKFWPGPLTIVFKARGLSASITAGTGTVGVRVSSSPVVAALIKEIDSPITATSANPCGKPPARSAEEVLRYFDGRVPVIIDGGLLTARLPSTVVDVSRGAIKVIREGAIAKEEIIR
jgi:L-threonylcarbamoyladenylate synthase